MQKSFVVNLFVRSTCLIHEGITFYLLLTYESSSSSERGGKFIAPTFTVKFFIEFYVEQLVCPKYFSSQAGRLTVFVMVIYQ